MEDQSHHFRTHALIASLSPFMGEKTSGSSETRASIVFLSVLMGTRGSGSSREANRFHVFECIVIAPFYAIVFVMVPIYAKNLPTSVPNQDVMIKTARISHTVIPTRQPSSISFAKSREWISLSLVIRVDCEMFPIAEFISFIVPEPPTSSWQACVRTSMGLAYMKNEGG